MQDKINLLLETILQESRAAREDIATVKSEMITHEFFQNQLMHVNDKLNNISNEQTNQKKIIDDFNNKFPKGNSFKNIIKKNYPKVAGIIFIAILSLLGFLAPQVIMQNHTTANINTSYKIFQGL